MITLTELVKCFVVERSELRKIREQKGPFNLKTVIIVLGRLTCSSPHDIATEIWKQYHEDARKRFETFQRLRAWVTNCLYSRPDIFTGLCERGEGGFYVLTEEGKELSSNFTLNQG